MQIKDIEIKNYRRFKEFKCEFHPRLTLLTGANGSGKTSLLNSIMGLFVHYKAYMNLPFENIKTREAHATFTHEIGGEQWRTPASPITILGNVEIEGREGRADRLGLVVEGNDSFSNPCFDHQLYTHLQEHGKQLFSETNNAPIPTYRHYSAMSSYGVTRKVSPSKPVEEKKSVLGTRAAGDLNHFTSWIYHYMLRGLQEGLEPTVYKTFKSALLSTIHAVDIAYNVSTDALEIKYEEQGWRAFDEMSDGQKRLTYIFGDLALHCALLNSHLGEDCITKASGVVTIDELDLHLHPQWQIDAIPNLLRVFPNIQFVIASHSPFFLQAAFDSGSVVDMKTGVQLSAEDNSIEDILEYIMGVAQPQRSKRFKEMKQAAQTYYELLERVPAASESEKEAIKAKLDELTIPYTDDPAYAAFLEMHRAAVGI